RSPRRSGSGWGTAAAVISCAGTDPVTGVANPRALITVLLAQAYLARSLGLRHGGSTGCSRAADVGCARCGLRPRVRGCRPGDPAVIVRRLPVQRGPAA